MSAGKSVVAACLIKINNAARWTEVARGFSESAATTRGSRMERASEDRITEPLAYQWPTLECVGEEK